MNTYHDWVWGLFWRNALTQASSLADGANYMRMIAAARGLENLSSSANTTISSGTLSLRGGPDNRRPTLHSRAGTCFAVTATDRSPRYGEPFPHKKAMLPYAIALDPVARAGETLSALVFRRGDVTTSAITIPLPNSRRGGSRRGQCRPASRSD